MAHPGKLKLIIVFIVMSFGLMFIDGLWFDNYNARPSMAMMHMDVKPTLYMDPPAPSLEEYFAQWNYFPDEPSDVDTPVEPDEVIIEDGVEIKVFNIVMNNVLHEIRPGVKVPMFSFNNRIPAPTIRLNEGDHVRVIFFNNGTEPHTIHWHGINNLKDRSDGVPDINQKWVEVGEEYTYEFIADPSGTRMYHCHVEAPHHINMGMFGAIIVDPKEGVNDGSPFGDADVEKILIFHEYDTSHAHTPLPAEMQAAGPDGPYPWLLPSPKFLMPFNPDFNEFLINGKSFPWVPPIEVKEGDVVRLRLINLGTEIHSIHIHGHSFIISHRDGFKLTNPFEVDTLMIGPAERYDVWFEANNPGLWIIHDHAGKNVVASGYDPAGIMVALLYDGYSTEAYEDFIKRAAVYEDTIRHADEHGMLTPSGGGGMMDMDMVMDGGGHG